jgi:hypothetical protein
MGDLKSALKKKISCLPAIVVYPVFILAIKFEFPLTPGERVRGREGRKA